MTTFPFIPKAEIDAARDLIERETGMSKRTLTTVSSIWPQTPSQEPAKLYTVDAETQMDRLTPVQGAVSIGVNRDGVLDEDLFEMYADRAVKGGEAVTNPDMLATMAALGCDSRHAHIFQTAVHAAVGGCWCDKCEAKEERLRQETAGMDSYQAIEHVLHQILYTRRGRLSALIHRVRDVGLHNAWVSWWRMRRLVWQFRKMEADHD